MTRRDEAMARLRHAYETARSRVEPAARTAFTRLRTGAAATWRLVATPPGEGATRRSIHRHVLAVGGAAIFLIGGIGVMGAATELAGAVIAQGSLVVESNVKKVQHQTGGTVGELLVHDGSRVEAGDLLLSLDPTEVKANLAAVTKALWELTARRARLEAERDAAAEIEFPADLTAAAADAEIGRIVAGERRLFELRRTAQQGQKSQLRERIAQLNDEIKGLAEQVEAKGQEISLIETELVGVRDLREKNLVPLSRLTALERDAARLRGERGALTATGAQARGKISEIELQIIQIDQNMRSDVAKDLADIRAKMAELGEKKTTAADLVLHIDIRAPQAGFVHQLSIHTKGEVVTAGEQIMLIVPSADALIVEVKIMPHDIDQVQLGQAATLRFPTFNQRTTPELNGTITRVAADIIKDDKAGTSYYLVRIALTEGEIGRLGGLRLVPGMPAEAFIRTQERTMLSYMVKPFTDQMRRAFREK